jgi:hypothetical protein
MTGTPCCHSRLRGIRPRLAKHKTTSDGLEHEFGAWIHTQRYKERRGQLDPSKVAALNARVPGWRSGRTRDRKPVRDQGITQPIRGLD